jgi:hypothetical protein
MSQQLTSLTGGVIPVQSGITAESLQVYSSQYIKAKKLESQPTQWQPAGRPVYRRLPAVSETYQVDFFAEGEIGYVYIPWGGGLFAPGSLAVSKVSDTSILISGGTIVWRYGSNPVNPALIDFTQINLESGRYLVCYELVYDDAPQLNQYAVQDFSLRGQPLNIFGSTDSLNGWRYPAVNAFLNDAGLFWSTYDMNVNTSVLPLTAVLGWQSEYSSAYSEIKIQFVENSLIPFAATPILEYFIDGSWVFACEGSYVSENNLLYTKFVVNDPTFNTGWRVTWESPVLPQLRVQDVLVTGVITLETRPSGPDTFASLALYPENAVPTTVLNSLGEEIPATYCNLAYIDVNEYFTVSDEIDDVRYIIHRDYKPIADWLTVFWDENLIDLYEQVKIYPETWMNPLTCLKQEYADLEKTGIIVQE